MRALKVVGGASFPALLAIAISFLPVLTLEAQEGRLFEPQAQQLLQVQDRHIQQVREVETVLGKAGRAETSTAPAPLAETRCDNLWRRLNPSALPALAARGGVDSP